MREKFQFVAKAGSMVLSANCSYGTNGRSLTRFLSPVLLPKWDTRLLWTGLKQHHSANDDTKSAQTKKQEAYHKSKRFHSLSTLVPPAFVSCLLFHTEIITVI